VITTYILLDFIEVLYSVLEGGVPSEKNLSAKKKTKK